MIYNSIFPNAILIKEEFITATYETIYMVIVSGILAFIIGLLLAILLLIFNEDAFYKNKIIYNILDKTINLLRAIPFIILMALIMPFTRSIIGTAVGMEAAVIPLIFGIAPFYAKQIHNTFLEVDDGLTEAALSMGLHPLNIIYNIYIKESIINIIRITAFSFISLIGLSAMAGAIGAGGIGSLAINMGFNRFKNDIVVVATIIILVLVYATQFISNIIINKIKH